MMFWLRMYSVVVYSCWNCMETKRVRIPKGTPTDGYRFECSRCGVPARIDKRTHNFFSAEPRKSA